ncbi:hypothetical protein DFAR_440011 [Desulfarculales bacterium]
MLSIHPGLPGLRAVSQGLFGQGAIRARQGVAHIITSLCVNCSDCFRACPHLAVRYRITPWRACGAASTPWPPPTPPY